MILRLQLDGISIAPFVAEHHHTDFSKNFAVRFSDLMEAYKMDRTKPQELIDQCLDAEGSKYVAYDRHGPLALFGCVPADTEVGVGIPWFIASERISKYPKALTQTALLFLDIELRKYKVLFNFTDYENRSAVKWLRYLGFGLQDVREFLGSKFYPFIRRSVYV